jgi:hypothetical protein
MRRTRRAAPCHALTVARNAASPGCAWFPFTDIEGFVFFAKKQINAGRLGHLVHQRAVELRRQRRLSCDLARGDGDDLLAVLALGDAQELPHRIGIAGRTVACAAFDVVARDQAVEIVVRLAGYRRDRRTVRSVSR